MIFSTLWQLRAACRLPCLRVTRRARLGRTQCTLHVHRKQPAVLPLTWLGHRPERQIPPKKPRHISLKVTAESAVWTGKNPLKNVHLASFRDVYRPPACKPIDSATLLYFEWNLRSLSEEGPRRSIASKARSRFSYARLSS